MAKNSFFGILKNKDFAKLWLAQCFSQLAFNMINFGVILRIYSHTGSITSVSLVLLASALPSVLFGPFSGVIADRLNYKKILVYTNFLRFFIPLLLIFANGNTLAVLEVLFISNVVTQFFAPAENSSFPLIVGKDELIKANSLSLATIYATLLVGYSIAGPILLIIGSLWFFLLCAALYLAATILIFQMSNYDKKEVRGLSLLTIAADVTSVWNETKAGLRYIYRDKKILSPLTKFSIGWMVLGSFIVLMPAFSEMVLGIKAANVGWVIIGPAGLGMLIGAILLEKRVKANSDKDNIVNTGYLVTSLGLLMVAIFPLYQHFIFAWPLLILMTMIMGAGTAMVYVTSQTQLHINSDPKMRGRVFGIAALTINLAIFLPTLFVGGISDLTTPLIAMGVVALCLIIYSIYINANKTLMPESIQVR
jgi:MFS family permease